MLGEQSPYRYLSIIQHPHSFSKKVTQLRHTKQPSPAQSPRANGPQPYRWYDGGAPSPWWCFGVTPGFDYRCRVGPAACSRARRRLCPGQRSRPCRLTVTLADCGRQPIKRAMTATRRRSGFLRAPDVLIAKFGRIGQCCEVDCSAPPPRYPFFCFLFSAHCAPPSTCDCIQILFCYYASHTTICRLPQPESAHPATPPCPHAPSSSRRRRSPRTRSS